MEIRERSDTTSPPVRPAPPTRLVERAVAWLDWFGVARLVVSAGAVAIVCAGAYWLVRTPPPPSEAALPRATAVPTVAVPTIAPPATPTARPDGAITVHVAGAVIAPGVYRLDSGDRVLDAIEAAGGAGADADADALNLAAAVTDGSRVYVPVVGEEIAGPPAIGSPNAPAGPIDVNRASATDLETLPGVGPATSAAIVAERERNGPFLTVDDLERVPGIGPAKLASFRDLVTT